MRCRILSDWTDVINSFAIFASVKLLWNVMPGWLYIDKGRLQGIPQNFYCNYPKNSLSWNSVYPYSRMVSYDFFLFMLKIETSTGGTNSMPFLIFRRDHLRFGIIFAVQFGDHFQPKDHLRSGIIRWTKMAAAAFSYHLSNLVHKAELVIFGSERKLKNACTWSLVLIQ